MEAMRVQLKQILCPTDFSEFSARAFRHAMAMAKRFDATLTVLHVIPYPLAYGADMPYFPNPPLVENSSLRKQAEAELRQFVQAALVDRVLLNLVVREGVPWREIQSAAEELRADLWVMGTHGRGGFERFILGSVTEKVLHSSACPVLTVCHEEGRTWQAPGLISRILCATDLTESSAQTISFGLSLAAENEAHLRLLHVIEHEQDVSGPTSHDSTEVAGRLLQRAVSEEARSWCEIEESVEMGTPYKKILELAAEDRSDLIVIGSRERRAIGSMLFGSTAQHVVRAATCPVLIVRTRQSAEVALATSNAARDETGIELRR